MTIEAVGLPSTFQNCIDCAAYGGRVVLIGVGKKNLDFNFTIIQKKELNIFGSRNALKKDFLELIDLVKAGKVDLEKIVTNTYKLDEADKAFKEFSENGIYVKGCDRFYKIKGKGDERMSEKERIYKNKSGRFCCSGFAATCKRN